MIDKTRARLESEISRIGMDVDGAGPVACIVVDGGKGACALSDDYDRWGGSPVSALERLKGLDPGCGSEGFWDAFPE